MRTPATHPRHRPRVVAAHTSARARRLRPAATVLSPLVLAALLSGAPPAAAVEVRDTALFTPPTSVSPPFGQHSDLLDAMDAGGDVTLVWNATVGEAHTIQAATIPAGGIEAGPAVALSGADRLNSPPALDVASSGRAAVAWFDEREVLQGEREEILALQVRDLAPGGRLEPLQTVWRPAHRAGYSAEGLAVAVDPAGDEVIAWLTWHEHASLMVTSRRAGGAFTPPVTLTAESPDVQPAVAMSPNGEATVLWCSPKAAQILASTWPAGVNRRPPRSWKRSTPPRRRAPNAYTSRPACRGKSSRRGCRDSTPSAGPTW